MIGQVYVTKQWLDNALPTMREIGARMACMISIPVALTNSLLWVSGVSARPRFTVCVAVAAWGGVIACGAAWFKLCRKRTAILKQNPPMKQPST